MYVPSLDRYVCHLVCVCCEGTKSSSYEQIGVTLLGPKIKMAIDIVQVTQL